ncbi:RNA chaperone Hfq [Bacillus cereus]|uniref:RNA chaperone Hfq n=1 Tax=Bacillus cereus TaxID=1396 RepID=A0A9X7M326_BACCE|nr:RNA chaperone Hfq [Bacillus cereus]QDZ77113.1 RNA chaperone Hfq [Bacillus cereus]
MKKIQALKKERNKNTIALQDQLWQVAQEKKSIVTLILVNGFHIKGMLKGYDMYAVWMELNGKSQLVYKHVISTIRL